MSFVIGKMRESVTFRVNTPTANGAGFSDVYSDLLTTRGQLEKSSANRSLTFGEIADNDSYDLYVRWQITLDSNLRSDTKIVINSVVYTMNGRPELIDQRKHIYKFKIQCQQP